VGWVVSQTDISIQRAAKKHENLDNFGYQFREWNLAPLLHLAEIDLDMLNRSSPDHCTERMADAMQMNMSEALDTAPTGILSLPGCMTNLDTEAQSQVIIERLRNVFGKHEPQKSRSLTNNSSASKSLPRRYLFAIAKLLGNTANNPNERCYVCGMWKEECGYGSVLKPCGRQLCRYLHLRTPNPDVRPMLATPGDVRLQSFLCSLVLCHANANADLITIAKSRLEHLLARHAQSNREIREIVEEIDEETIARSKDLDISTVLWPLSESLMVALSPSPVDNVPPQFNLTAKHVFLVHGLEHPLSSAFERYRERVERNKEERGDVSPTCTTVYHGSRAQNWYSILKHGLRIMSDTPYMSTGAAHGVGVYVSPDASTAQTYASSHGTHENIRCIAVCDLIDDPKLVTKHGTIYVVKQIELLRIRMLIAV
jgi:hypothetical protein